MIIAIPYENNQIFQHFGHTKEFKIYTVENNKIIKTEIIPTNGSGHGALSLFLHNLNVTDLICGGIGSGAQNALREYNINIYGGVNINPDTAVNDLIKNNLNYNKNASCDHHDCIGDCGEHDHHQPLKLTRKI